VRRCAPAAIRWFRDQYGVTVLDYYGLTESYPLCGNFQFMEVREGSMGRPMPGWDMAILDEDERPVAQGERGEICMRARTNPHYPLGYWRLPAASAETFGGEWFHTKDAASMDADGYVWYEGRADDVIVAAGYRIGPFEVESACLEHAAVAEAAAVASPDERRGNVVKAFIVLSAGYEPSDALAQEIKDFARFAANRGERERDDADAMRELADRPLELTRGLELEWLGVAGYRLGFSTNVNLAAFPDEVAAVSSDFAVTTLEPMQVVEGGA
jgi:acyl-coenzyme A synthetase/AMP-(fatty) acid ligase